MNCSKLPIDSSQFRTTEDRNNLLLEMRPAMQARALTDLFFLTRDILGYEELNEEIHRPLCDIISATNPVIIHQAGDRSPLYHNKHCHKYMQSKGLRHSLDTINSNVSRETIDATLDLSTGCEQVIDSLSTGSQNNDTVKDMTRQINDSQKCDSDSGQPADVGAGGGGVKFGLNPQKISQKFQPSIELNKVNVDNKSIIDTDGFNVDSKLVDVADSQIIKPNSYEAAYGSTEWLRSLVSYDKLDKGRIGDYIEIGEGMERLFVLHRGCFKTTIISIAHTIQLLLIWPEIRILINSHKKEGGSIPILGSIRTHFKANRRLRALFPEYCPTANTAGKIEFGTQDKVILPNRDPACSWPEANIEVAGLTTDTTGRHYDYIKNDDLVTKDSVTNENMIQKTREFKSLQPFLFNQPEWGVTDNIGTIYHFNDLWCELKKLNITKVLMPIWNNRTDKQIVFYERFSTEGINKIKDSIGDYEFACQYELNPVPPEGQTFKPEWLERDGFYYEPVELEGKNLRVSIYLDPASRRRKTSDYTAWCVIGVDDNGTKYLLDIGRDKLSTEDRTNKAIDLCQKWKVHKIHYETIGFQDTDKYIIDRKMRERKYYIEVVEIKASANSKEDRIKGLQPLYMRGDIRWPRSIVQYSTYSGRNEDMIKSLKDEMFMFPKCIHDDMLDCHSFMLRVEEYNASKPIEAQTPDDKIETIRKVYLVNNKKKKKLNFGRALFKKKRFEFPSTKTYI